MALVDELLLRRGESAYAVAARARSLAHPDSLVHDRRVRVALAVVGLLVAGLVLGVAAAEHRATGPADRRDRVGLVDAVRQRQETVQAQQAGTRTLRALLAQERARPAPRPAPTPDPSALAAAGLADLTSSGVALTVDNPASGNYLLTDRDLQSLVNGLWAAGATGVAVDGRRLTALSAIRTAGRVVLVNYEPVTPPYLITATGPAQALRARFLAGAGGTQLTDLAAAYDVRSSLVSRERVRLPGAEPALRQASPGPP